MAGLLDFIQSPGGQGLLSAAFGGLAGARRGAPLNSIGRGGLAGLAGYAGAQDRQAEQQQLAKRNQMFDLQFGQAKRENEINEGIRRAGLESVRTPAQMSLANGQGPTVSNAEAIESTKQGFDTQGFMDRVMGIDPLKGIALQQSMAKETPFAKVDPKDYTQESVARFAQTRNFGDLKPARKMEVVNNQAVDLYNTKPGTQFDNVDPNKPFMHQNGQIIANPAYQQFELEKASRGAAKTSVKVENKMGESIAGQVGPILKDSRDVANGASQTVDAADRIVKAIDSNKVYAGPGASARLKLAQIGQAMGVGGKDEAERIANTRQVIRGLAEMTLKGRQQMKGQGAITESESALAERATSGDLDNLTAAEIKQLANASARASRHVYKQHADMIGEIQQNPNTQGLASFYRPLGMPNSQVGIEIPNAPNQPANTAATMRWNPNTGKLEQVR